MDVFVSYATPDRDRVKPIVDALEKEGWSVWWDRNLEAGSTFDREIESALDSAKCVLVVWTQHSIESDWVLAEAGDGLERGILVPLLLESVRPPLAFRRAHTVMREDVIEAVTRQVLGASAGGRLHVLTLVGANDAMPESVANRAQRIAGTFRGRVHAANGALMFQFPSAIAAVRAGLELRTKLEDAVALGVSSVESGSEENPEVAALAAPGELCLTDDIYQEVRRRLELAPDDLGEQVVAGAAQPIHVFRIGAATPRIVAQAVKAPAAQTQDIPTLAVMSFRNMNANPDFEYFGDGIAVDVVEELLRIPRLHVVSTMSSFTYKNSSASAMEIGRELGVAHVLEGTVRLVGSQVRIATQLARTSDGQVEWAEHFDRPIDDVFKIQDEITREITLAMDVKFYKGEMARVEYQLMRSPMARQKFYQGWEAFNRLNRADSDRAKTLFEEAIAFEPECPFPYAMLAWANYLDMERGWTPSSAKSRDLVESYAEQALSHGDRSGIAPLVTSYLSLLDGDYDDALATSAKVIEQRPSCPGAFSMRAGILNYSGNASDAVEPAHKALRLSPVVQPVYPEMLSLAYYLDNQLDLALEAANDTLSIAPDSIEARVVLTAALIESGRARVARDSAMDILALDPSFALERYKSTHPFRDAATLQRITRSLGQAGLEQESDRARTHGLASESRRRLTPQRKH